VARSAVSDEEIQLRKRARRRLVGAIALVVLVVAAVPMILDSEPRQSPHRIEVQVPPIPQRPPKEPAPPALPRAPALPKDSTQAPALRADSTPAQLAEPVPSAAAAAAPPAAAAPARDTAPARAAGAISAGPNGARAEKGAAAATSADAYAVALIATSSASKASDLKRELQRLKFPAYTQKTPDGDKLRVRVGPYSSREAAEQARQRLIRQGYEPGKVVRQGD